MEEKKSGLVENITLTRVPMDQRKPWISIAFIWAGSVICIPALMVGSFISAGMNFAQSALCMAIGYSIVVVYMCLMGIQSADLGLPSTVAISRAYGKKGSSFLVSLNKVSVPALFVMLIWGVVASLMKGAASAVSAYEPPQFLGWSYGITLAVAGFAAGAIISGDYTRYCKSRRDTVLSCVVGVLPAGIGALLIGAFLSLSAGSFDLAVVFSDFGLPIIGLLVLILATWTTNTGNAYTSGIAICNMFSLRDNLRSWMTLLAGVIGTLLCLLGFSDAFNEFLNLIAALVPTIAGVAIADYWIMGKGRPDLWKPFDGVNWMGVVSWIAGAAVAKWSTFFVPTLNGIVTALLCYCLLAAVIKNERLNPIYKMQLEAAAAGKEKSAT